MALAGQAIVCSFNDVVPEGRENLYEWHSREHMPERLGIPGFLRGRRYIARRGAPEYFILYEIENIGVGGSADYLARLNDPTPWTKISSKNFRNSFRSVLSVPFSVGLGMGGFAMPIRFDSDDLGRLEKALLAEILPPIEPMVGVTGVHLAVYDVDISAIQTTERAGRGAPFAPIPLMILVEAVSEEVLDRVAETHLQPGRLEACGAKGPLATGVYQMEICRTK